MKNEEFRNSLFNIQHFAFRISIGRRVLALSGEREKGFALNLGGTAERFFRPMHDLHGTFYSVDRKQVFNRPGYSSRLKCIRISGRRELKGVKFTAHVAEFDDLKPVIIRDLND